MERSRKFVTEHKKLLYPASSRLLMIPPMFYDVVDEYGNIVLSEGIQTNRAIDRAQLSGSANFHPNYNDLVEGSTAHPGHTFPRSPGEFSRLLIAASRPSKTIPEFLNAICQDSCDDARELVHHASYRKRYPETYRGNSTIYNQLLGRYLSGQDSSHFRYYRHSNPPSMKKNEKAQSRYSSRMNEIIHKPMPQDFLDKFYLTKRTATEDA